jgi:vacuolar-type H+-ATPase subunit D/Vma8
MNTMFESIKHHITNATQQLSGDLQQVVDSNSKFKQEVQEELQEMRQFLAEQKRLLGIQSSSEVTTSSYYAVCFFGAFNAECSSACGPPVRSVFDT